MAVHMAAADDDSGGVIFVVFPTHMVFGVDLGLNLSVPENPAIFLKE